MLREKSAACDGTPRDEYRQYQPRAATAVGTARAEGFDMAMRVVTTACLVAVALVTATRVGSAQVAAQSPPPAAPAPASASAAVPFRTEAPLQSYVAVRRMESRNERHEKEAWLRARTELHPDGTFSYQILEEGGSEFIRKRVLRPALEREAEVHRDGTARRGGLTPDNYMFQAPAREGNLLRVGLVPRKRQEMLVKGSLVTSADGELLRVEGELVKRPSFWTKSVQLVRSYERVGGLRVPVRFETVAQVRLVGRSTLVVTYDYLEINGQSVVSGAEPPPTPASGGVIRTAAVRAQGIQR